MKKFCVIIAAFLLALGFTGCFGSKYPVTSVTIDYMGDRAPSMYLIRDKNALYEFALRKEFQYCAAPILTQNQKYPMKYFESKNLILFHHNSDIRYGTVQSIDTLGDTITITFRKPKDGAVSGNAYGAVLYVEIDEIDETVTQVKYLILSE